MNKPKVLIFGSSGHAKIIINSFEKEGIYEIVGLLDSYKSIGETVLGYPVVGSEKNIPQEILNLENLHFFVAVGDNWNRQIVYKSILLLVTKAKFASTIHPSAQIGKNVKIGKGVAILAGTVVSSEAEIGNFVVVNTNAGLAHDCKMSNFSSLGPKAATGGNVSIGDFTAISIGATLTNKISIGKHSIIGAGALLMKNCGDNKIMYGVPAKIIRDRAIGEEYMI